MTQGIETRQRPAEAYLASLNEAQRAAVEFGIDRLHEDAAMHRQDIAQLARIAAAYSDQERFLTELTLDPRDATSDESGVPLRDENYLIALASYRMRC